MQLLLRVCGAHDPKGQPTTVSYNEVPTPRPQYTCVPEGMEGDDGTEQGVRTQASETGDGHNADAADGRQGSAASSGTNFADEHEDFSSVFAAAPAADLILLVGGGGDGDSLSIPDSMNRLLRSLPSACSAAIAIALPPGAPSQRTDRGSGTAGKCAGTASSWEFLEPTGLVDGTATATAADTVGDETPAGERAKKKPARACRHYDMTMKLGAALATASLDSGGENEDAEDRTCHLHLTDSTANGVGSAVLSASERLDRCMAHAVFSDQHSSGGSIASPKGHVKFLGQGALARAAVDVISPAHGALFTVPMPLAHSDGTANPPHFGLDIEVELNGFRVPTHGVWCLAVDDEERICVGDPQFRASFPVELPLPQGGRRVRLQASLRSGLEDLLVVTRSAVVEVVLAH
jgi:hypothetical protein